MASRDSAYGCLRDAIPSSNALLAFTVRVCLPYVVNIRVLDFGPSIPFPVVRVDVGLYFENSVSVASVFRWCGQFKIAKPVIVFDAVFVVNLKVFGALAVKSFPYQLMR